MNKEQLAESIFVLYKEYYEKEKMINNRLDFEWFIDFLANYNN